MTNADRRAFLAAAAACAIAPGAAGAQGFSSLTQADAAAGLREALGVAAGVVTTRLGREDGFWGDARVRIPLPDSLARVQGALRPFRLSGALDDLELRVNRGAERAMPAARRLLNTAIRSITLQDALGILQGGDDSATRYLRSRTQGNLTASLRPVMEQSLEGAGAFTALDTALRRHRVPGSAASLRGQVLDFAVARALDVAFSLIADEERAIRADPVRRTTGLLRRVFGD